MIHDEAELDWISKTNQEHKQKMRDHVHRQNLHADD